MNVIKAIFGLPASSEQEVISGSEIAQKAEQHKRALLSAKMLAGVLVLPKAVAQDMSVESWGVAEQEVRSRQRSID